MPDAPLLYEPCMSNATDDQLLLGQDVKIMHNDEKDKENAPYLASVGKAACRSRSARRRGRGWDVVDATKEQVPARIVG